MADFISSRNKHRRIYGYERNPKQPFTIIEDGVHRTFDKNSITVHRDYFLIRDSNFQQGVYSEYEENLINVLGYSGVVTFQNGGFTQLPIVTIEPTNPSSDNVNFYLTDITQYGFTYGVSSFFSGALNYKAIYAPNYPVTVSARIPLFPALSCEIFAGQQLETLVDSNIITFNFTSSSIPISASMTPYDGNTSNIYVSGNISTSGSNINFSSLYSGSLNYIMIKS